MIAPPDRLAEETYDLIIIGAGINGAGIARDAAMRGLSVLLLDKGDVCSGTSSWSTRLIHGGLRYLEYREIGLVRESLREREYLLHDAPHLVKPLPLIVPIYAGAKYGPWMVRMGMIGYDVLSYDKSVDHHHMLSRDAALQRMPGLNADGLRGAAIYYDAQVEYAERLVLENVLSAREHGATVRLGVTVHQLAVEAGRVVGVDFTTAPDDRLYRSRAHLVINVAGPWVDQVLRLVGRPMPRLIGGTKGTHLVVDPFPGAPRDGIYAEAAKDRRPYFILPWNDRYLIGTTDIRFEGDLDHLTADEAEIDYLLRETDRVIPAAGLTRDSVLYTYTGVRPLPYVPEGAAGAITRRHIIHDHAEDGLEGMMSIVGGKLTTYRSLAEETVDAACKKLGRKPVASPTLHVPLPGATSDIASFSTAFRDAHPSLSPHTIGHLLRVYGTRANMVLAMADRAPDLLEVFDPETGAIGAEIVFSVQEELAHSLADILLRRTMVGLGPNVGIGADMAAAEIARRHLGWDAARIEQEFTSYRHYVQRFRPRILRQPPAAALREQQLREAAGKKTTPT